MQKWTGCPFLKSISSVKNLFQLQKHLSIPQSIKHSSYQDKNYPWEEKSKDFNKIFRERIWEFYSWFNQYATSRLQNADISSILANYDESISPLEFQSKIYLATEKSRDKQYLQWMLDCSDTMHFAKLIILVLQWIISKYKVNPKEACTIVIKKIFLTNKKAFENYWTFINCIQQVKKSLELEFDSEILKWNYVPSHTMDTTELNVIHTLFSLQERHYNSNEIELRNTDPPYWILQAFKVFHYLLWEFTNSYIKHLDSETKVEFIRILQEIVLLENDTVKLNSRLIKVLSNNCWPFLQEIVVQKKHLHNGDITEYFKKIKPFEQFILWITEKDCTLKIETIEMKSCPAKITFIESIQQLLPIIYEKLYGKPDIYFGTI